MTDRYSFSLTTFSPSGNLVQIEHALNAVSQGVTSVGIKAVNGVVIAGEKSTSVLVKNESLEKVSTVCANIGMVYSGMGPDARILLSSARKSAYKYSMLYNEDPPVSVVVKDTAQLVQEFTQSGGVRPFGASLLICGYDETGPSLYQVDPSGSYWAWKATAIGKHMVNGKNFLGRRYNESIEIEDAIRTAIMALKEGFEGQISEYSIEVGVAQCVTQPGHHGDIEHIGEFRKLTATEIKDYLNFRYSKKLLNSKGGILPLEKAASRYKQELGSSRTGKAWHVAQNSCSV